MTARSSGETARRRATASCRPPYRLRLAGRRRADDFVTFVDDPAILAALEGKGYGFAGLFGIEGDGDLATLNAKSPAYKKIVEIVGADVAALRAEMKAGGRPLYEVTDGNVGRVIDMRWLTTEAARFRLAGSSTASTAGTLPRPTASRMRRGPLHLPPRLRLQEEGQAAGIAPAGRFQRRLFRGARRRRRMHRGCRPLAAAARRGGRCRLAGRRADRSVRPHLQAARAQRAGGPFSLWGRRPSSADRLPI